MDVHRALSFNRLHSNNSVLFGYHLWGAFKELITRHGHDAAAQVVTDVPRGSVKRVRFSGDAVVQELRQRVENILAIRESEELAEEAVRLGRMVSSDAPLY